MSARYDGGTAFPAALADGAAHLGGMTLRDYFAAQAMTGMLIAFSEIAKLPNAKLVAGAAYETADAMLEARDK